MIIDKKVIKKCMKSLGIDNANDTIMIGDTEYDGFAANELGMNFICCTYGFGFKTQNEIAQYKNIFVANDACELLKFFC